MDLSHPIGRFDFKQTVEPERYPALIEDIAAAPGLYRAAVRGLDEAQLDTPYRPGGWTVRQTVHHVADSHMNSFIRFRLALTEEAPAIVAYNQAAWGELADSHGAPVEWSLNLIESLHSRWVVLLKAMGNAEFSRTFRHPELGLVRLDLNMALYAWHGRHHAAHITGLRERSGWK
jgi:hypothetical protein